MATGVVYPKRGLIISRPEANENDQIKPKRLKPISSSCLNISADCFLPIFGFLNPEEVALAELVNKVWQRTIDLKNQVIWKQQYLRLFPEVILLSGEGSGKIYKRLLVPIYGDVWLCFNSFPFIRSKQDGDKSKQEPSLSMKVSFNSLDEVRERRQDKILVEKFATSHFVKTEFFQYFPLRCLINSVNNKYKNGGNEIKLLWSGYRVILTCKNFNNERLITFAQRVKTYVNGAMRLGNFSEENVNIARDLAKTAGEWVRLN